VRFYSIAMMIFMMMLSFTFINNVYSQYVVFPNEQVPSSYYVPTTVPGGVSTGGTTEYSIDLLATLQWIGIFINSFIQATFLLPWMLASFLPPESAWIGAALGIGFQFCYIGGIAQFVTGRMMRSGR